MAASTVPGINVHIRWMIRRDMPEVLAIDSESFEFPWVEEDFKHHLRQRNCIGMVAEHDDRVVGYMVYELGANAIRILNFAVASKHRRREVGTQMVARLIDKLSEQRRTRLVTDVRESNLPAQLFFKACGLRAEVVIVGMYADTNEDAYRMVYRVGSPAAVSPKNRIAGLI